MDHGDAQYVLAKYKWLLEDLGLDIRNISFQLAKDPSSIGETIWIASTASVNGGCPILLDLIRERLGDDILWYLVDKYSVDTPKDHHLPGMFTFKNLKSLNEFLEEVRELFFGDKDGVDS